LTQQWTEKQNRLAAPTAELTATVINMFRDKNSKPVDPADLLPFKPPPIVLTEAESEAALDRFFGAYLKKQGVTNGAS